MNTEYDLYLEKDGVPFVVIESYSAKAVDADGQCFYIIDLYKLYLTAEAIINSIDIKKVKNFTMVVKSSNKHKIIQYLNCEWADICRSQYQYQPYTDRAMIISAKRLSGDFSPLDVT